MCEGQAVSACQVRGATWTPEVRMFSGVRGHFGAGPWLRWEAGGLYLTPPRSRVLSYGLFSRADGGEFPLGDASPSGENPQYLNQGSWGPESL